LHGGQRGRTCTTLSTCSATGHARDRGQTGQAQGVGGRTRVQTPPTSGMCDVILQIRSGRQRLGGRMKPSQPSPTPDQGTHRPLQQKPLQVASLQGGATHLGQPGQPLGSFLAWETLGGLQIVCGQTGAVHPQNGSGSFRATHRNCALQMPPTTVDDEQEAPHLMQRPPPLGGGAATHWPQTH